jgi:hypothetical protein
MEIIEPSPVDPQVPDIRNRRFYYGADQFRSIDNLLPARRFEQPRHQPDNK